MEIDPKPIAQALLDATHAARGEIEMKVDVGDWPAAAVCGLVDHVLSKISDYRLRFRGIRVDPATFAKLGIQLNTQNSGDYKGVVVVISSRPEFDFIELVLRPVP